MNHLIEKRIVWAAAAIVAIGALLPWVKASSVFVSLEKTGVEGDGIITLGLAIVVAICAMWNVRWAFLPALPLVGFAIFDLVDTLNRVGDVNGEDSAIHASVGIGLWLTVLGAAVAFVAACVARAESRNDETLPVL